eukprot:scaffold88864_cov35-Tisochrysis_lutea.AAC.1
MAPVSEFSCSQKSGRLARDLGSTPSSLERLRLLLAALAHVQTCVRSSREPRASSRMAHGLHTPVRNEGAGLLIIKQLS